VRGAASALGLLLFLSSACVTSSRQVVTAGALQAEISAVSATARLDPDRTITCDTENIVGSHIPQRICQSLRQTEQSRLHASNLMRKSNICNNGSCL
jgi:hypothetical protein